MSTSSTGSSGGAKMTSKPAEPAAPQPEVLVRPRSREKTRDHLLLAILSFKNKGKKLTISAVAAEAGVTSALIHNTYPDIAEQIRVESGRGTRQRRDEKTAELGKAKLRMQELRAERDAALADLKKCASINETIRQELATLRAATTGNVFVMPRNKSDL